jgi:MFS family permease
MATAENNLVGDEHLTSALQPGRQRTAAITLTLICLAVFLTALDQTVVVTALNPIANTFILTIPDSLPALSWIVSGYLLGYVIMMPLMGRISDLYGRRRVLLACLALFGAGSLICAVSGWLGERYDLSWIAHIGINSPSPALSWLVLARFLQAIGGGAVVPTAIAAIGDIYGERQRILALGVIGGVTEAGGALGPLYGAIIIQKWTWLPQNFDQSWQWIFLLNLPLVGAIMLALWLLWPQSSQVPAARQSQKRATIDWPGALLLGGALVCLSTGLGQEAGAIGSITDSVAVSQNNPILLGLAALLFIAFIVVEARWIDPVIPLGIFRSKAFSAGAAYSLLLGIALIIALVDVPLFVLTFSSTTYLDAGFALLRMTVMIPLGAFTGGWLVSRFGCRLIGTAGTVVTAMGFLVMHQWGIRLDWTLLTIGTIITGIGFGLIVAPVSTTALNSTSAERFGTAASVVTALRMIGMIIGLALLSSWGLSRVQQLSQTASKHFNFNDPAQISAYGIEVVHIGRMVVTDLFTIGAIFALLAIIPALMLWRPAKGEQGTVTTFSIGF